MGKGEKVLLVEFYAIFNFRKIGHTWECAAGDLAKLASAGSCAEKELLPSSSFISHHSLGACMD